MLSDPIPNIIGGKLDVSIVIEDISTPTYIVLLINDNYWFIFQRQQEEFTTHLIQIVLKKNSLKKNLKLIFAYHCLMLHMQIYFIKY